MSDISTVATTPVTSTENMDNSTTSSTADNHLDAAFDKLAREWDGTSTDGKLGYGYAVATDTGIAVQRGQILVDLFYETYAESVINGAIQVNVYVVD